MLPTDADAALDARVRDLSDDDLAALAADGCAAELARYRPHDLLKRLVAEVQAGRGVGVLYVSLKELRERVRERVPDPSHVWNNSVLNCCIRCEAFYGQPDALLPCDPSKLAGKTEWCCNCANEYPRSDLIAGHIYCPDCRSSDGAPG